MREAASMLGVHHSTISRAVKKGVLLPAFTTPGGLKRFRSTDVLLLKNEGKTVLPSGTRLHRNLRRVRNLLNGMEQTGQILTTSLRDYPELHELSEIITQDLERMNKIFASIESQIHDASSAIIRNSRNGSMNGSSLIRRNKD